jgi:exodeoxyribonuclease III
MREKNKGWRLDYFIVSNSLDSYLEDSGILKEYEGSDHCPIYLKLNI